MKVLLRAVLFFDALLNLLLGVLLLMSPFATLYAALQLPPPQPALFGQLLGVALVGLAWLLVQATLNGQLTVAVARTVGQVNLVSAVLVLVWVVFLDLPVQGAGKIWLLALAAVLGFFAAVQLPAAKNVRRRERALAAERQADIKAARDNGRDGRPPDPRYPNDNPTGVTPAARPTSSPEYRREPVITPPPGYGPGTEVMTEPEPEELPPAHHARQNPYS